jgi:hypothetical protein
MIQTDLTRERMYKWFYYEHLPVGSEARIISASFKTMAGTIIENIEPGPERTVALRKLLEAKDAAVRAVIHPGG